MDNLRVNNPTTLPVRRMIGKKAMNAQMDKINILYVINQLSIGGAEQQLLELVRGLNKERYNPLVASLSRGGAIKDELERAGIPVIVAERRIRIDPSPIWKLVKTLRDERIAVMHSIGVYGGLYGRLAAKLAHAPVVISAERQTMSWARASHNQLYFWADRFLARWTDRVIANANAVARYATQQKGIDANKVHVIYNGVNLERFDNPLEAAVVKRQLDIRDDKLVVGIIARLDPMKDHRNFLQAASLVLQQLPRTIFLIVGEGMLRHELEKHASELNIEAEVILTGARRDVRDLLSIMDVFVLSSQQGEGCSNAILEAMTMAKPVVATDVGGNAEIVLNARTGYIVPPKDPARLAQAVLKILEDEDLRKYFGEMGRKRVEERFSVRKMVSETEKVYEELIHKTLGCTDKQGLA